MRAGGRVFAADETGWPCTLARFAWIAAVATVTAVASLGGQEVTGVARAGSSGLQLPEATVVLVNAAGGVVSGTITRPDGNYTLLAPSPGDYRVRARRIGFSPDSSEMFRLATGSVARFDPRLSQFTAQLPIVPVEETRRCTMRPQTGAVAVRLWQEAQNALAATAVTSRNARIGFVLRRFERETDPATSRVLQSRAWEGRTLNLEPYASIAAESLAAHGFVTIQGKFRVFYAPDAKTLTSDAFTRFRALCGCTT